jgi:hypothetical protein
MQIYICRDRKFAGGRGEKGLCPVIYMAQLTIAEISATVAVESLHKIDVTNWKKSYR